MFRKRWFVLFAGTLMLATAQSVQAGDTVRLGGSVGLADIQTLDLRDDTDADTELARYGRGGFGGYRGGYGGYRGGFGGYQGGFYRGGFGGYRGGYNVGFRYGGFGGGYRYGGYSSFYRPYYGSYYSSYRPSWGYGSYYPSYYSYPVYSYPVYQSYSYYTPCSDSVPTMPYATVQSTPSTLETSPAPVISRPVVPAPAPAVGDGSFHYDGGPGVVPMPIPGEAAPIVVPRPVLPRDGRLVSLPKSTPTVSYPAYGERAPTISRPADRDTRLVSTTAPTPHVIFSPYGKALPRR